MHLFDSYNAAVKSGEAVGVVLPCLELEVLAMQRSSIPHNTNKPIYLPENTPRRVWELDSAMASEQIVEIDVAGEPKRSLQQDSIGGLSVCKGRPMCVPLHA